MKKRRKERRGEGRKGLGWKAFWSLFQYFLCSSCWLCGCRSLKLFSIRWQREEQKQLAGIPAGPPQVVSSPVWTLGFLCSCLMMSFSTHWGKKCMFCWLPELKPEESCYLVFSVFIGIVIQDEGTLQARPCLWSNRNCKVFTVGRPALCL